MMTDLHIGVRTGDLDAFFLGFNPQPDRDHGTPSRVIFDGSPMDSWEEWVEPARDDEEGRHVIVRCSSVATAIENYAEVMDHWQYALVPMKLEHQVDVIAVVTATGDWGKQYLTVLKGGVVTRRGARR